MDFQTEQTMCSALREMRIIHHQYIGRFNPWRLIDVAPIIQNRDRAGLGVLKLVGRFEFPLCSFEKDAWNAESIRLFLELARQILSAAQYSGALPLIQPEVQNHQ